LESVIKRPFLKKIMELSKEGAERIVEAVKEALMKKPDATLKLGDKEIKRSELAKVIDMMDEKGRRELAKIMLELALKRK